MSTRIGGYIRQHHLGLVAIFIALSGTAYASHPGGDNTIDSGDIIDAEVKNPDLAPDSIGSGKIFDGTVRSADVANDTTDFGLTAQDLEADSVGTSEVAADSLTQADLREGSVASSEVVSNSLLGADVQDGSLAGIDVADNSLTGADVQDNSLTGADINEGTLSIGNSSFTREQLAGRCNPSSTSDTTCISTQLSTNPGDNVLVIATGGWFGADGAGRDDTGVCTLRRDGANPGLGAQPLGQAGDQFNNGARLSGFALTGIFFGVPGGTSSYDLTCDETEGDMQYDSTRISAVVVGP